MNDMAKNLILWLIIAAVLVARLEEIDQPIDRAALVADEEFHLRRLRDLRTLLVVDRHLLR